MGHATHFLERLERVSLPQAELALSLYRDEGLLKYILQNADIPDRAPRVAISLDHPTRGPFIIVTHSGHFVTCLGEGMSKGCWPVVTRDKLDRLAGKIEALRERIADAARRTGRYGRVSDLLRRILTAGYMMSREQFSLLVAWQPLMVPILIEAYIKLYQYLEEGFWIMRRRSIRGPRYGKALLSYANMVWALGHLSLLIAVSDRKTLDAVFKATSGSCLGLVGACIRQGVFPLAARGIWTAGKIGKPLLREYKQKYLQCCGPDEFLEAAMGLTCIGHRYSSCRAEVAKVLKRQSKESESEWVKAANGMRTSFSLAFEEALTNPELARALIKEIGFDMLIQLLPVPSGDSGKAIGFDSEDDVPDDLAFAVAANSLFDCVTDVDGIVLLLVTIPCIARAKPEDFYLPAEVLKLMPQPDPKYARYLIDVSCRQVKLRPVKAEHTPGRNQSCSCGSGKKYKRCCGLINRSFQPPMTRGCCH